MRQTVRAWAAKPAASAILVATLMAGAVFIAVATSEDDPAPSTNTATAADGGAQTETPVATPREERGVGVAGAVAGFGLISVWVVGGAIGLRRSQRRNARRATPGDDEADDEADDDESAA